MPRYFLHLFDSSRSVFDDEGTQLDNADAARAHALWCLRDVVAHGILAQVPVHPEAYMSVEDHTGAEICRVHVREIPGIDGASWL